MRVSGEQRQLLAQFFISRFSTEEMRALLGTLTNGAAILAQLPGSIASCEVVAHEAVAILARRGEIDNRLFSALRVARPALAAEVERLVHQFQCPPQPDTYDAQPERSSTPLSDSAAPSAAIAPDEVLVRLLATSFSDAQVRRLVAAVCGDTVELPPATDTPTELATAAVAGVHRRGTSSVATLLGLVRAARPLRSFDVQRLAERLHVPLPAEDACDVSFAVDVVLPTATEQRRIEVLLAYLAEGDLSRVYARTAGPPQRDTGALAFAVHRFLRVAVEVKFDISHRNAASAKQGLTDALQALVHPPGLYSAYAGQLRPAIRDLVALLLSVSRSAHASEAIIRVAIDFALAQGDDSLFRDIDEIDTKGSPWKMR